MMQWDEGQFNSKYFSHLFPNTFPSDDLTDVPHVEHAELFPPILDFFIPTFPQLLRSTTGTIGESLG
jgi:hypothetical protein